MMDQSIRILLVEDNPDDVELTLHALKKNNIVNPVMVVRAPAFGTRKVLPVPVSVL